MKRDVAETNGEAGQATRSLAKGLQILEMLAIAAEPMPLRDIARFLELGKASTLRLLRTLQQSGYLVRDQHDNYRSDRDRQFPRPTHFLPLFRAAAAPVLARLNAEFGETVALAFLFDDHIRVVDVLEGTHDIRMSNYKGRILPPYASSLAKSVTAFQTPEHAQRLLHTYGIFRLTPATLTDFRAIQEHLAEVREQGYAWDRGETVTGGMCIAVPIRMPDGEVRASVSISMPRERFTEELQKLLPDRMREDARKVTEAMKFAENCETQAAS